MRSRESVLIRCAVGAVGFVAATACGAEVAAWEFDPAPPLVFPGLAASSTAANVTASDFTSNDGVPTRTTTSGPTYWVTEQGWTEPNTYLSCTIQAQAGFEIQLTSLVFEQATLAATGPSTWRVRSSLDGFAADLASGNVSILPTFTQHTVDLSGGTIGATPVEFRWFAASASNVNTSWGVDDVVVNGEVVATNGGDPNQTQTPNGTTDPNQTQGATGACCAGTSGLQGMIVMPVVIAGLFWMKVRTHRSRRY